MATAVIAWVLGVIFPSTDRLPGLDGIDIRGRLAEVLDRAPLVFRLGLYGATALFLLAPILTVYLPLPAMLLPRNLLDRHAHRMSTHPVYLVRQSTLLVKSVGALIWGADPTVRAALGMAPLPADPRSWQRGDSIPAEGTPP